MPRATYLSSDGTSSEIEVSAGTTLMRAAEANCIEGIVADCGGNMSCATCHIYVDPAFLDRLPPPSSTEDQMLDFTAAPRQPNSRLSCQVVMTDALDGVIVRIADPQL